MSISFLKIIFPLLWEGFIVTVQIAVLGIFIGFLLGCVAGYALQSKSRIARSISTFYLWIIRGIPLIVLAYWIYYASPLIFGFRDIEPFTAGVICIALNSGAFIAELVRGALSGVDNGQKEAGAALGLTHFQVLRHIVIPPAFRAMLPALFNQFIISLKDTSLLTAINVNEIARRINIYASRSFKFVETWTVGALFYLVVISILILVQKKVEKKSASTVATKPSRFLSKPFSRS